MEKDQTPAPKQKTITIDLDKLPEGVTAEKVVSALASLDKRKDHTYAYNKSRRVAMKHLSQKFPKEYEAFLEQAKNGTIV